MTRRGMGEYPANWDDIARNVKSASGWRCVRCRHSHDPVTGHTLTVHHADMDATHSGPEWWFNLLPLCQRCHLQIQGKVNLQRPWIWEHSEWFKPYAAGWYGWRYLGLFLSREEVEARLDELLALEAQAVIGREPVAMTPEARAQIDLSESAGNSFTLGPYIEVKGLTDDELIILGSFLAHNPVRKLLQTRAALEPFARAADDFRDDTWDDSDEALDLSAERMILVAQLRAARAAWLALGGEA